MDYDLSRRLMVEEQLIRRGIKDKRVINAFCKVPRHRFLPENLQHSSYGDFPLPIGENQTISQPYIVALMTESLQLCGKEKILEVGTGSGYQTAILAELSAQVFSIERMEILANRARAVTDELGYKNIEITLGDGTLGLPQRAPFDARSRCNGRDLR